MILKPLSSLIDPGTRIARTMSTVGMVRGSARTAPTGYLVFAKNGELVERRLHSMQWDNKHQTAQYIVHNKVNYAVDLPSKPISGAFNVQSLYVHGKR